MPYLHLDLPGTYPVAVKRELATRLCKLYADIILRDGNWVADWTPAETVAS
jgi:hypothetical protein